MERRIVSSFLVACLLCGIYSQEPDWNPKTAEADLLVYLKRKSDYYGTVARPVANYSDAVTLWYGLRLIQVGVDETTNTLTTSVWIRHKWYDKNMVWNSTRFDGVERIMVPCSWLWIPELSLVNTGETEEKEREAKCLMKHTGYVWWLIHRTHRSACLFDVTNYPFDEHTCHMWFQSIEATSDDLDIQPYPRSPMDLDTYLSDFQKSDEWEITSNETIRVETPRELGELLMFSRRTTLRFTLCLRRRAGFRAYLLTVPCVVLGAMSILVFALPAERPDRHSLATSLLGSFMFLLLILVNTAPPSAASVPKLGLFYAFNICMIVMSLCLSAIVVNVMRRGDKKIPMPRWVEKVFLETLAQVFLCQQRKQRKKDISSEAEEMEISRLHLTENTCRMRTISEADVNTEQTQLEDTNNSGIKAILETLLALKINLSSIDIAVHRILRHKVTVQKDVNEAQIKWKWRLVALVLDRIFMVAYVFIIIISLILLLPRASF